SSPLCFFSSRRRHTSFSRDWSSDVCSSDLTQPALLTVSVAAYRVLAQHGVQPDVVAGHSLGEYSALVAAGALEFADAVRLVRARGQFMNDAVPAGTGTMGGIIGLDAPAVEAVCPTGQAGFVEPATYNCPGQVVVAGEA